MSACWLIFKVLQIDPELYSLEAYSMSLLLLLYFIIVVHLNLVSSLQIQHYQSYVQVGNA